MDDAQLGLDALIGFLAGCKDGHPEVSGDVRVVMLPEFGTHEPLPVTGVAIRFIARSDDPPTVAIEYRPAPGAPVPGPDAHKLAREVIAAWNEKFTGPADSGTRGIDYQMAVLAVETILSRAGRTAVPRMCVLCSHPERGHCVPSGHGGARWPLDEMDCAACPSGKCTSDGLHVRPMWEDPAGRSETTRVCAQAQPGQPDTIPSEAERAAGIAVLPPGCDLNVCLHHYPACPPVCICPSWFDSGGWHMIEVNPACAAHAVNAEAGHQDASSQVPGTPQDEER